ncbi:MAG: hypothetical protein ACFFB3_08055 [Candidatus Hodarchaeota archaeon]
MYLKRLMRRKSMDESQLISKLLELTFLTSLMNKQIAAMSGEEYALSNPGLYCELGFKPPQVISQMKNSPRTWCISIVLSSLEYLNGYLEDVVKQVFPECTWELINDVLWLHL